MAYTNYIISQNEPLQSVFTCHALIKPFVRRYHKAPFPMCITPQALNSIVRSVGTHRPETGGFLFGPTDTMGIDLFEFDVEGSAQAGPTIYSPDAPHGLKRMDYHLSTAIARVMWGIAHSHPGGFGEPSQATADGNGDLGYAAQFFAENEAPLWFFMPIVTQQQGHVFISPFIVHRDNPDAPFIAPALIICPADEFPKAEYNPAFLKRIAAKVAPESKPVLPLLLPAPPPILALPPPSLFPKTDMPAPCTWTWQRSRRYWRRVERRRERFGL